MRESDLRMAWGRISGKRITYVRFYVNMRSNQSERIKIGNFNCGYSIAFPKEPTSEENIKAQFWCIPDEKNPSKFGICTANIVFDGVSMRVLSTEFNDDDVYSFNQDVLRNFKAACARHLRDDKKTSALLMQLLQGNWRYDRLKLREKNIHEFFSFEGSQRFRISARESNGVPWLLVEDSL